MISTIRIKGRDGKVTMAVPIDDVTDRVANLTPDEAEDMAKCLMMAARGARGEMVRVGEMLFGTEVTWDW